MDELKNIFNSKLDSLVEKFRTETSRQSEENFINTRRLTIESPYKPQDTGPSHDIDRQITDLESLIKRLQDEIIDMSSEVDKPLDEDDLRSWFTKSHFNFSNDKDNANSDKTNTHIYPITLPNVGPLINDRQNLPDDLSQLINSASTSQLAENFSAIRRNFSLLWDDVIEGEIVTLTGENVKESDTNVTFAELRAEILENINSQEHGMPLNNSNEELI